MRKKVVATSVLLVLFSLLVVIAVHGCLDRGADDPRQFLATYQQYARDGDFGKIWELYSDGHTQEVVQSIRQMQQKVAQEDPASRKTTEELLRKQHGIGREDFLRSSAREIHEIQMASGRDAILALKFVRVEGGEEGDDTAMLYVTNDRGFEWPIPLVRSKSGGWLWAVEGKQ